MPIVESQEAFEIYLEENKSSLEEAEIETYGTLEEREEWYAMYGMDYSEITNAQRLKSTMLKGVDGETTSKMEKEALIEASKYEFKAAIEAAKVQKEEKKAAKKAEKKLEKEEKKAAKALEKEEKKAEKQSKSTSLRSS